MKTTLGSILLLFSMTGCASMNDAGDGDDPDIGTTDEAINTGCGNRPLCDCALKGTPQCADPDGDGVPNLDDICPNNYDPGQADCDGDGIGDACDSDSSFVVSQSVGEATIGYQNSNFFCPPPGPFGSLWSYWRYPIIEDTTYLQVQLCGPSGTGVENRTSVSTFLGSPTLQSDGYRCN